MNNEETKQTEFAMGTLYDLNKGLVQQSEIKLSEGILNSKKEIIKNFLVEKHSNYYMLLCNERKDYTIFRMGEQYDYTDKSRKVSLILVDECLVNRGEIRGIDITQDKEAIEIWMSIEGESYVYYFFPYDNAVIEMEAEMEA